MTRSAHEHGRACPDSAVAFLIFLRSDSPGARALGASSPAHLPHYSQGPPCDDKRRHRVFVIKRSPPRPWALSISPEALRAPGQSKFCARVLTVTCLRKLGPERTGHTMPRERERLRSERPQPNQFKEEEHCPLGPCALPSLINGLSWGPLKDRRL